jgi:hypothetical protein
VCLNYGARVVAVDLSGAIDAAYANLKDRDGIFFLQADIFRLPFRRETFDFAYSWGVLHHTPDPQRAFEQLPPLVVPGGKMMAFVYASYNKAYLATTELYRKLTTRLPKRLLLMLGYIAVPLYYVWKIPVVGPFITRILLPVSVRAPTHRWRSATPSTCTPRSTRSPTTTWRCTSGSGGPGSSRSRRSRPSPGSRTWPPSRPSMPGGAGRRSMKPSPSSPVEI